MATSTLILHRGAREVTREEFESLPVPPATKTWAPVSHSRVLDTAVATHDDSNGSLADALQLQIQQLTCRLRVHCCRLSDPLSIGQ